MKTRTRNIAILLTCVAFSSAASAQPPQDSPTPTPAVRQQQPRQPRPQRGIQRRGAVTPGETSEAFSHVAQLTQGGTFELRSLTPGEVIITGGPGGRMVRIEATKRVRNVQEARARALLDAMRIDVAERGGNVAVRTMPPMGVTGAAQNRPVAIVDYRIVLPPNANLVIRTGSGNLRVVNVFGDAFVIDTLSGDVVMQESRGRMLDLHTIAGNMQLLGIAVERAMLESTAGNIEYAGELQPTGLYKFQTHRGNIRVTPSGTPGFDLDAMSFRGVVRSDFALRLLQGPPARGQRAQKLRGKFGDAGAAVTASTFGGDIVIIKP